MHGCTLFALLAIAVLRWSISVLAPNKGSNAMPAADVFVCQPESYLVMQWNFTLSCSILLSCNLHIGHILILVKN